VATRGLPGGGGEPAGSPTATAGPPRAVKLPKATPVEKLWPQATIKLPAKLPNGRMYAPEVFVDDHTLLASTRSSFEKTDALWLYDIATRRLKLSTRVTTPANATTFASHFTGGDGHVAWWTGRRENGETVAEIWSAPLRGGQSRKITAMSAGKDEDGGIERLVIAGGKAIWSLSTFSPGARGGIFTAPITGGEPAKIPGSDGYHIVDWPWVGTPGYRANSPDQVAFKDLRNIETGERRTATVGPGRWICGLTWCEGGTAGPRGTALVRRDGSGGRLLPGVGGSPFSDIALDRFVVVLRETIQLYDLRGGRLADLGSPGEAGSYRILSPGARLYWVDRADGFLVVNLAAIR
jgi:hypothetical protein